MIPNLSEEEKEYFDRWVKKSLRRHKRANTWKAIGPLIYLAATILFACAAIRACNEITWKPKPSDFVADSLYVDSVINGRGGLGPIESDTGSPEAQRVYDSSRGAIGIHFLTGPPDTPYLGRCFTGGYHIIRYNGKEIARMALDSTRWQILDSGAWLRAHIFYRKMNLKKWEDSL